jgi:hypothetical protein
MVKQRNMKNRLRNEDDKMTDLSMDLVGMTEEENKGNIQTN